MMRKNELIIIAVFSVALGALFFPTKAKAITRTFQTAKEQAYMEHYNALVYDMLKTSPLEVETVDGVEETSGHLKITRTDLSLDGVNGMDLNLSRYYDSNESGIGSLSVKTVDKLDVNTHHVEFKNGFGKTKYLVVNDKIYQKKKQALKSLLFKYKRTAQARIDQVESTETTTIDSGVGMNPYQIAVGWYWDLPWIECYKVGLEAEKPKYLHLGSKGVIGIDTSITSESVTITGLSGYSDTDIQLLDYNQIVDGISCRYLYRDKTGMRTYFNSDGLIVMQKDNHNNTIKYKYDGNVLSTIEDSVGRKVIFSYGQKTHGIKPLSSISVAGTKIENGISKKLITYRMHEVEYQTLNNNTLYGTVLDWVIEAGEKESYQYKEVESLNNTCGGGIASQRALTNKTFLLKTISLDGSSECFEYRGMAMKNPSQVIEIVDGVEKEAFRNVATNVFVVTRQYDRENKTGKRTNGIKYDYFEKIGDNLISMADFSEVQNEFLPYGLGTMKNYIFVKSKFNAAKYKGNKKKSDYSIKKGRINKSSLDLKKAPKKEISIDVFNSQGSCIKESVEGRKKQETLFSYYNGHKGLLSQKAQKDYGNNRNKNPRVTYTGYKYDSYRNLIETKDNKAFLSKNAGKEYLFITKNRFNTSGGYPSDDKAYALDLLTEISSYLDEKVQMKTINLISENGLDIKEIKEEIKSSDGEGFEVISKTKMAYNSKGDMASEQVFENMKDTPNSYIKTTYDYDDKGNQVKSTKEIKSEEHPESNKTYIEEESTFDDFGNELVVKDEKGIITKAVYDSDTEEEIIVEEAVGTEKETKERTYQSEDKKSTLTLDQYGRGTVEIKDGYGNTIISKDEKFGTWTESVYDYERQDKQEDISEDDEGDGELLESEELSEANVNEDSDDEEGCDQADLAENVEGISDDKKSASGLLIEEKVYPFEPQGAYLDSEGKPNFEIKGKGSEILSASKHMYDREGNEIMTASFSGGDVDAKHCSSLTVFMSEMSVIDENGDVSGNKTFAYEKKLNPEIYSDSFIKEVENNCDDSNSYYNHFNDNVLSEEITETITDLEGNISKEINTSKAGKDTLIKTKTVSYDLFGKQKSDESLYSGTINGSEEKGPIEKNEYSYDIYGNQTEVKTNSKIGDEEISQTSKSVYDIRGKIREYYTPRGVKNQYASKHNYDIRGVEVETKNPITKDNGEIVYQSIKSEYDESGNLLSKSEETVDGEYIKTEYSYDENNNLVMVKDNTNDKDHYTQYVYDLDGNKIRQFSGMTSPLTIKVKEGDGEDSFTYVKKKYYLEIENPSKKNKYQETKYEYDKTGKLISETNPKGKVEKYIYDVYGNQTKVLARDGDITSYDYDYQGRIIKEKAKDKGTGRETTHTFSYDAYGNVAKKDDSKLTYQAITGLLTKEEESIEGKKVAKSYDYDISGNRTKMEIEVSGQKALNMSYKYDAMNRLTHVRSDGKEIANYTYDEDGSLVKEIKSETGLNTNYQYNYQGKVLDMKNMTSAGKELSSFKSVYDLKGRKIEEEEKLQNKDNKNETITKKYVYDKLNRLVKESQTGMEDILYTYDSNNNRIGKIQGYYETSYKYNKNNELLRTDTLNRKTENNETTIYRYDANGNQLACNPRKEPKNKSPYISLDVTLGSSQSNDNTINHYNANNELIRTLTRDKSVTFEYNADGLRSKKKNHQNVTYYIWDGDQLVLELDKDAKVTKRYLYGNSLISSDSGEGKAERTYITNPHGDVIQLVDGSGNIIKTYRYDSFGNEIDPDESDENPIRYAGEYFDVETKTQYLRARYYAPELGRFISRDTYTGEDENSTSLHLYTYCENEPVGQVDPSGNYSINDILKGVKNGVNQVVKPIKKPLKKLIRGAADIYRNSYFGKTFAEDTRTRKNEWLLKCGNFYHKKGSIHTETVCWQMIFGYNDFYDYVFDSATLMKRKKIVLKTRKKFMGLYKKYIMWAWKGDYFNFGAGGEMGIYSTYTGIHTWVETRNRIYTKLYINMKGKTKPIVSWKSNNIEWWITGFNPKYQDGIKSAKDLKLNVWFSFSKASKELKNAFYKAKKKVKLKKLFKFDSDEKKWEFRW